MSNTCRQWRHVVNATSETEAAFIIAQAAPADIIQLRRGKAEKSESDAPLKAEFWGEFTNDAGAVSIGSDTGTFDAYVGRRYTREDGTFAYVAGVYITGIKGFEPITIDGVMQDDEVFVLLKSLVEPTAETPESTKLRIMIREFI